MTDKISQRTTRQRPKVVLVVDDDEDAGGLLASILESNHYQVLRARDGADALRVLEAAGARNPGSACNIILLDLMMPVMNGWDFRRKQRASPRLAGIPVVVMSAGAHIAAVSGELESAGYMTKPVDIHDLLAKVEKHCN